MLADLIGAITVVSIIGGLTGFVLAVRHTLRYEAELRQQRPGGDL
jgi:hypothetical protein